MIEITGELLDEIERKAKAATPERWAARSVETVIPGAIGSVPIVAMNLGGLIAAALPHPTEIDDRDWSRVTNNGAHIARMDPPTTLALVARIRELEARTPAIPEGWKLVPIEPSDEMVEAFADASWRKLQDGYGDSPTEHPEDGGGPVCYGYRAMLAAAPEPPVVCNEPAFGDAQTTLSVIGDAQAIRNAALEEAATLAENFEIIPKLLSMCGDDENECAAVGQHEAAERIAVAIRALKARETPAATIPAAAAGMSPKHKLAVAALVAIRDIAGIYGVADNTAQDLIRAALEAHGEPTEDLLSPGREGWDQAEAALAAYREAKEGANR